MEFKNIIALTTIAILTETAMAATNAWEVDNLGNIQRVQNVCYANAKSIDAQLACYKTGAATYPTEGPLATKQGLYEKQDEVFGGITREQLVAFIFANQNQPNGKASAFFSTRSGPLKSIFERVDATANFSCNFNAGATVRTCANHMASIAFKAANPANWPADMNMDIFEKLMDKTLVGGAERFPLASVNKIPAKFLESKPAHIVRYLQDQDVDQIHLVDSSVLKKLLKTPAAVAAISPESFAKILKNPELAKLFDGKTFNSLSQQVKAMNGTNYSKYVRNLPKDAFTHVNSGIHETFLRYATKEQIAKFQTKCQDADPCLLRPGLINQHYTGEVDYKVWRKYFKRYAADKLANGQWFQAEEASMKKWSFWKRIPMKAFKTLVEKENVGTLLPSTAFKLMSKEQRDAILKAGDRESPNTTCADLPIKILAGKQGRLEGLSISSKCLKAKLDSGSQDKGKWAFEALKMGIVQPKAAKKLTAAVVKDMEVTIVRPKKADKNRPGKMIKPDPLELKGLLAFEGLRNLPNGAEYVKAFFSQDNDEPIQACKDITDKDKLRKCTWLQPLLNKKCIKAMSFDLDELAKLDPNITANLSKAQIEKLGGRAELKELSDNVAAGLGKNKAFAKIALEVETKEKDDKEVNRKYLLQLIKAEQVKKYFGAEFVSAVPEQHVEGLVKVLPGLSDSALAKADAAWIASHAAVLKGATDEQHGHISDDVETGAYPASLSVGAVTAMPVSRVKALSAKFVGKMTPTGISAFSAEQVAAIPAESLCLVCGDKAAAFKHELSAAQKESLGKDCPAAKDSMAPSQFGAIAALAAAAAGSIALLL